MGLAALKALALQAPCDRADETMDCCLRSSGSQHTATSARDRKMQVVIGRGVAHECGFVIQGRQDR